MPYEVKDYEIEDFKLGDNTYDNSLILFNALKELPKYILSSNRFWAWITFEKAYRLAQENIPLDSADIIKNWWLTNDSRRGIMLQVIGRLYFKVETSVDFDNKTDIYHLTKFLFNTTTETYRNLVFRNISMLKQVSLGFLETQKNIEDTYKIKLSKDEIRTMMKEMSKIGSVRLIDAMTKDEIKELLFKKMVKILYVSTRISLYP